MSKSILKSIPNEYIYIVSDILIKGIAFLTLPLFTTYLTTEEYGKFTMYQTYVSIFSIIIGLNISNAVVRFYFEKKDEEKNLFTGIWSIFFTTILVISFTGIYSLYTEGEVNTQELNVIVLTASFGCIIKYVLELLRAKRLATKYGIVSITNSLLSTMISLILVVVFIKKAALLRLTGVFIANFVTMIILMKIIIKEEGIKFSKKTLKSLLQYSIPLIPYVFSTIILAYFDRIFIAKYSGMEGVGIYSFAYNVGMIISVIAIGLNKSFQPEFFEAMKENKDYRLKLSKNIKIFIFLYIVFLLSSDLLVNILGSESYLEAKQVIPIIALSYAFIYLYSLYINVLYYYKKNVLISSASILCAVINILLNIVLVPLYGYYGAAITTAISYIVLFYMVYVYSKVVLKCNILTLSELLKIKLLLISVTAISMYI